MADQDARQDADPPYRSGEGQEEGRDWRERGHETAAGKGKKGCKGFLIMVFMENP
jgi:hypothetical protein